MEMENGSEVSEELKSERLEREREREREREFCLVDSIQ
jgi:hypothetical protein